MKLHTALDEMAALMVRHDQLHLDAMIRHTPRPGLAPTPAMQKASDDLHDIDRLIARLAESSAANPMLYPHMMCWMIDVSGRSEAAPAGALGSPEATAQLDELLTNPTAFAARQGSLMHTVRAALEEQRLTITDSGGGGGHWDLGVPCDDAMAAAVCNLLHVRFARAIESGVLIVRRRFWRWRFRQLCNVQAAREYLKSRPS